MYQKITNPAVFALAFILTATGSPASAQMPSADDESYVAVVTAAETAIRAGGSKNYYTFGKAKQGEMVRVVGSKYQWAQVQTIGPAFKALSGIIKQPREGSATIRLSEDGLTAVTLGAVEIYAFNRSEKALSLENCWKKQGVFGPEQTLTILETIEEEKMIGYRVALPVDGVGWIPERDLRPADSREVEQWKMAIQANSTVVVDSEKIEKPRDEASDDGSVLAVVEPKITPPAAALETPTPPDSPEEQMKEATPTPLPESLLPEARSELVKLEKAFSAMPKNDLNSAEVAPLRRLYMDLQAKYPDDARIQRYAGMRVEQLGLWMELQQRQGRLAKLRQQARLTSDDAKSVAEALERTREYAGVGRLTTSTIYTGRGLPRLFRLIEPSTGRTLAYLRDGDTDGPDLTGAMGRLVGIVGSKGYDGRLGLYMIESTRIDYLAPRISKPSAMQQPALAPGSPGSAVLSTPSDASMLPSEKSTNAISPE